jgi:predicted short-subunit dehydrogenase-like oxidoreductase (DUF2520 family)
MTRKGRPPTVLIGTGRLSRALGPLLQECGYPVAAVVGRRSSAARSVARTIPGASASTSPERSALRAGMILLAVPDREIASVARRLALAKGVDWSGKIVLHHAGSLGLDVLRPLEGVGAGVGLLHPMQALGRPDLAGEVLPGSRARIEGCATATAAARRLARDLGLVPLGFPRTLDQRDRLAYHAAASLASNDLVALLALAADVLETTGLDRQEAIDALVRLAAGTLAQASPGGLGDSLTGPLVRGDTETVAEHLRVLERESGPHAQIHLLLSARLLALAEDHGHRLPPAERRRLQRILSRRAGGRRRGPTV